ncbi:hypothetical protein CYMTET_39673 [Cymbomonas tetramitiformis]|uniref:PCIF1 WW domain-containing protein n=1 Tax=Cymbomonas tetramitiformis TaxID=36881 RepID=A0AAE0C9L6_9CHLO|nr:hypothetical protein CYMTET_39673 [Cymbomonas tetramitiformis]
MLRLRARYKQAVGQEGEPTEAQAKLRKELWREHNIRVDPFEDEIASLLMRYSSKEEERERKRNLQNHWTMPPEILRALQEAFGLSTEVFASPLNVHQDTTRILKVKAHVGIEGNEQADKAAKQACEDGEYVPAWDNDRTVLLKAMAKDQDGPKAQDEMGGKQGTLQDPRPRTRWEENRNGCRTQGPGRDGRKTGTAAGPKAQDEMGGKQGTAGPKAQDEMGGKQGTAAGPKAQDEMGGKQGTAAGHRLGRDGMKAGPGTKRPH